MRRSDCIKDPIAAGKKAIVEVVNGLKDTIGVRENTVSSPFFQAVWSNDCTSQDLIPAITV
jgi:hypothetical protein